MANLTGPVQGVQGQLQILSYWVSSSVSAKLARGGTKPEAGDGASNGGGIGTGTGTGTVGASWGLKAEVDQDVGPVLSVMAMTCSPLEKNSDSGAVAVLPARKEKEVEVEIGSEMKIRTLAVPEFLGERDSLTITSGRDPNGGCGGGSVVLESATSPGIFGSPSASTGSGGTGPGKLESQSQIQILAQSQKGKEDGSSSASSTSTLREANPHKGKEAFIQSGHYGTQTMGHVHPHQQHSMEAKDNKKSGPVSHFGAGTVYQPAGPLIEPHKMSSSSSSVPAGIHLPDTVRLPPDLKVTYQTHPPASCSTSPPSSASVASSTKSSSHNASSSSASSTSGHHHHHHGGKQHSSSSSGKSSRSSSVSNASSKQSQSVILHQPYKSSTATSTTNTTTASSTSSTTSSRSLQIQQQQQAGQAGPPSGTTTTTTNFSVFGSSGTTATLMAAPGSTTLSQQQHSNVTMTAHHQLAGQAPPSSAAAAAAAAAPAGAAPGMYYPGYMGAHHSPFAPSKYPMVPPDSYRAHSPYPNSFLYGPATPQSAPQNFYMTPFYTPPMTPTPAAPVVVGGNGGQPRPTTTVLPNHGSSASAAAAAAAAAFYQANPSLAPANASHLPSSYYVPSPATGPAQAPLIPSHHSVPSQPSPGHAGLFRPNPSSLPACPCPMESCPPRSTNNSNNSTTSSNNNNNNSTNNNNNKSISTISSSSNTPLQLPPPLQPQPPCATHATRPAHEAAHNNSNTTSSTTTSSSNSNHNCTNNPLSKSLSTPSASASAATSMTRRRELLSHPPACTTPAVAADPPKTISVQNSNVDIAQARQLESAKTFTEQYSLPDDITITPILVPGSIEGGGNICQQQAPPVQVPAGNNSSALSKTKGTSSTTSTGKVQAQSSAGPVTTTSVKPKSAGQKQKDIVHVIDPRSGQTTTIAKHMSAAANAASNNLNQYFASQNQQNQNQNQNQNQPNPHRNVSSVKPNNAGNVGKINPDLDVIVLAPGQRHPHDTQNNHIHNNNNNNNGHHHYHHYHHNSLGNTNKVHFHHQQQSVTSSNQMGSNSNQIQSKPLSVSSVNLVQPLAQVPPTNHNNNNNSLNPVNNLSKNSVKRSGENPSNKMPGTKRKGIHECIDVIQKKKLKLLEEEKQSNKVLLNGSDAQLAVSALTTITMTPTARPPPTEGGVPRALTLHPTNLTLGQTQTPPPPSVGPLQPLLRKSPPSPTAARALARDEIFEMRNSTIVNEREALVAASALVIPPNGSHIRLSPHKNGMKKGRGWNVDLPIGHGGGGQLGGKFNARFKITTRSSTANAKIKTRSSVKDVPCYVTSSRVGGGEGQGHLSGTGGSGSSSSGGVDQRSRSRLLRRRVNFPGSGNKLSSTVQPYQHQNQSQHDSLGLRQHFILSSASGGNNGQGRLHNTSNKAKSSGSLSSPGSSSSSSNNSSHHHTSSSNNNHVILRIPRVPGGGGGGSGQPSPSTSASFDRPDREHRSSLVIRSRQQQQQQQQQHQQDGQAETASSRLSKYGHGHGQPTGGDALEGSSLSLLALNRNLVIGESSGKYKAQISGSMAFNALKKRAIVKPLSPNVMNGALHSMMMARRQPKWSNGWRFEGDSFEAKVYLRNDDQPVIRRCYPAMRHDGGDVIQARDCVLLKSGPRKTDLPFVAKVAALWENPADGEMMFSLLWYYRPEHTDMGRTREDMPDEIFASKHRDCNSVATIEDRCFVLTLNEYCRYKKRLKQLEEGITAHVPLVPLQSSSHSNVNLAANIALAVWNGIHGDERRVPAAGKVSPEVVFFCRKVYDYRQKRMLKNPS